MATKPDETREGVPLTNLDQPLFDGADATKRDLIEYLDGVRDRIIPVLEDRPLSVIRVHRGQEAFMQKNVPKYTPEWVRTVDLWAEASKREVSYALCNDRRTLLWFANQRAVEYHPALVRVDDPEHITHLVLDLDPPEGDSFAMAVRVAHLVRQALADAGLDRRGQDEWRQGRARLRPGRRISGLRGLGRGDACDRGAGRTTRPRHRDNRIHEGGPRQQGLRRFDTCRRRNRDLGLQPARAARAFPCRSRSGGTISTPSRRATSPCTTPSKRSATDDPWAEQMPSPQQLPAELVEEGHTIPVARVQAMHEGKRRARSRRKSEE